MCKRCRSKLIGRLMRIRPNQSIIIQSGELVEFLTKRGNAGVRKQKEQIGFKKSTEMLLIEQQHV